MHAFLIHVHCIVMQYNKQIKISKYVLKQSLLMRFYQKLDIKKLQ